MKESKTSMFRNLRGKCRVKKPNVFMFGKMGGIDQVTKAKVFLCEKLAGSHQGSGRIIAMRGRWAGVIM